MSLTSFVKYFGNSRQEDSSPHRARTLGSSVHNPRIPQDPPPDYTELEGEQASADVAPQRKPQDVSVIAVMGPTGAGKSTFIGKLATQSMRIGHTLTSCKFWCVRVNPYPLTSLFLFIGTKEPEEIPCKIGDKTVILVDTPGFNDTFRPDTDILASLVDWMKASYQEMQLSGIIYLHDIKLDRMYGSSLTNLRMFRRLCGDDNLKNVILATTKWSDPPKSEEASREEQLCSDEEFWGLMIQEGSLVRRFDNTKPSARALVEEILDTGKEYITPRIQHEVVELGKNISETEAGAFIDRRLIEQAQRHQQEVEGLMEEQDRARRKRKSCHSTILRVF